MLVYNNTKGDFVTAVNSGRINGLIQAELTAHHIAADSVAMDSLNYMCLVLNDRDIDDGCKVAIEYQIPLTSKRVDFLISGKDDHDNNNIVIVELKQWENSDVTTYPGVVKAYTGGAVREVCHPCYQAYSYSETIKNFNDSVGQNNIALNPCAYLHNYKEKNRSNIDNAFYKDATKCAKLFLQNDSKKLNAFIKNFIKKKDDVDLLMKIEHGKLKPSKSLQDSLASMINGNTEFVLIDEQKVIFERIKDVVSNAVKDATTNNQKKVVIVSGGPGTGKSVVAIQLLCDLIRSDISAVYVTKNKAPRDVYFDKLRNNNFRQNYIKELFKASDSFWYDDTEKGKERKKALFNALSCLIVDEAHRLQKKSSIFHGENQVRELINAGRVTVFFIDEDQPVTTKDIGSKDEIRKWASYFNAEVIEGDDLTLVSQFRCNGSDGYLNFLNNLLEIKVTANVDFDNDYEIRLFDDAAKMQNELRIKNDINNKSRMLAGYCYEWVTGDLKKKAKVQKHYGYKDNDPRLQHDFIINSFVADWNYNDEVWATNPSSFDRVGCIHTSQGLDFDYCGVIIGKDLRYENGHVITDKTKIALTDETSGIRSCKDKVKADKLIRNTYKVLLSRGQKGCYIYCEDKALMQHMSEMLKKPIE